MILKRKNFFFSTAGARDANGDASDARGAGQNLSVVFQKRGTTGLMMGTRGTMGMTNIVLHLVTWKTMGWTSMVLNLRCMMGTEGTMGLHIRTRRTMGLTSMVLNLGCMMLMLLQSDPGTAVEAQNTVSEGDQWPLVIKHRHKILLQNPVN